MRMAVVKRDATPSTNDFLKEMAASQEVENFTVVTAETQTRGRGQMGATWTSEPGKNLIMSILIKGLDGAAGIFNLNVAIALAVLEALDKHDIPELSVKWPNDIMAGNKKVAGILIENTIKNDGRICSVVGIGLNVNQTDFTLLPKASSLAVATQSEFDRDMLLSGIVDKIKSKVCFLESHAEVLWDVYHQR